MRILDRAIEEEVADAVVAAIDSDMVLPEEAIPGLILATKMLAKKTPRRDIALEEASELLADN